MDEKRRKARRKGKIVDTAFYLTLIIWGIVYVYLLFFHVINIFITIPAYFVGLYLITKIFLAIHTKAVRIKR